MKKALEIQVVIFSKGVEFNVFNQFQKNMQKTIEMENVIEMELMKESVNCKCT